MTFANGRLQLRCADLDVETLTERELCLCVFMLHSKGLLVGAGVGSDVEEREDLMNSIVLLRGLTLTDAGRDLLRQVVRDHVDRLRTRQTGDRHSEERTRRKTHSPPVKPRPDLGVTLASIGEVPRDTND